jgi:hypothetical protein
MKLTEQIKNHIVEDTHKWSTKVYQDRYGWAYKLLCDGEPQGTSGSCNTKEDAEESAAAILKSAKQGGYAPPGEY